MRVDGRCLQTQSHILKIALALHFYFVELLTHVTNNLALCQITSNLTGGV